jgi:tellurite resistance protein
LNYAATQLRIGAMITLNPRTLQRIRDHLLDLGAPPSTHFLKPGANDDPFHGDEDSKKRFEALFEAMFLMVVADGSVADEEREVLRGATRTLTDNAIRTAHVEALFDECKARLGQGMEARVAAISDVLKADKALSESAFSLASAIAFADSAIEDEENELINDLADALGIDPDRADELLNQLDED